MTVSPISEDQPRFGALVVTAAGVVLRLTEIEMMQTEKSDNGDAGTWSMTLALALNTDLSGAIGPMDIVALYAARSATDALGNTTNPGDPIPNLPGLTYGATDAASTLALGTPSCLMIGMVDSVDESFDYEGARVTLTIGGRDLTKIFIDNDTLVPETIVGGGASGSFGGLSTIIVQRLSSGTQLLEDVLDTYVAKDPNRINALLAAYGGTPFTSSEAATLASYGYPWRNFVRADLLITGFQHLSLGQFPNFSVQNGSAWVNTTELRNYPITRLYVNEVGALIFDDTWTAWGFGTAKKWLQQNPMITLDRADVRKAEFRKSDDDLITALSIVAAQMSAGDTALAGLATFGKQNVSEPAVLSRFGYRYFKFESQYDPTDAFLNNTTATTVGSDGISIADIGGPSPTSTAIYDAAQNLKATNIADGSDRGLKGAPYRNECVAAVQTVLDRAGIPEIGGGTLGVPEFVAALPARGWVQITQGEAVPGDFVVVGNQDHIGIYEGRDTMISNGSTKGSFTWEDSPAAQAIGCGGSAGQVAFYHYVEPSGSGTASKKSPTTPIAPVAPTASQAVQDKAFAVYQNALNARFPILWTLHNNLWTATFTLKGNAKWRAGQRFKTDIGGAQVPIKPLDGKFKSWYIISVQHSLQWGADWTTTLTARFPQDSS